MHKERKNKQKIIIKLEIDNAKSYNAINKYDEVE